MSRKNRSVRQAKAQIPSATVTFHQIFTEAQFAQFLDTQNIRHALTTYARSLNIEDPENAVHDMILIALDALQTYDFATYGYEGLTNWMKGILRRRVSFSKRKRKIEEAPLDAAAQTRWSQLNGHKERAILADVDLNGEARARFRLAPLTHLEVLCLSARLDGEGASQTAARLGIGVRTVQKHNKSALDKVKAVPGVLVIQPDSDFFATFREFAIVTTYTAPTTWGAGKAREDLAKLK